MPSRSILNELFKKKKKMLVVYGSRDWDQNTTKPSGDGLPHSLLSSKMA